nr:hypothetical protein [Chitinophagaceae bacterium]
MPTQIEIRIRNIQKTLKVPQTGVFDLTTCLRFQAVSGYKAPIANTLDAHKRHIQKNLGFVGREIDAIYGGNTLTRIEDLLNKQLPSIPSGSSLVASRASLEFIVSEEISSEANYTKRYQFPTWPGGDSGVTIGIGYDLGYVSTKQFESDWKSILSASDYKRLVITLGKKGMVARDALTQSLKRIVVPLQAAKQVFYLSSMPKYAKDVKRIYPGVDKLPPDAQGALLSLVYNRGAGLAGDRKAEMRNIVSHVASGNLSRIATEIRNMKRLWIGQGLPGLLKRRDKEADLVLHATFNISSMECVVV